MDIPSLQVISIVLEAIIAVLAFLSARRKRYMYGLTVTFAVYVLYDLSRYYGWSIDEQVLQGLFFAATLGALYSIWKIYRSRF
ncbi:MAG: hypothetical protein COV34_02850 [Candidatus Zambryskibacteria bacterium CG10_big_fil_rev_8_21_14_0_10_42_12]|uniref:Uncharacterized protein n=1 Tax=Candidatus Zambryskibacteria bacterium CG10_big_fil_rev_8_21_14_0_10_42_12 TaxID=1975115 RepID=A0A2H0QUQ0_9BACT|nr:MAG: hypothetical protein COV34_02850 [Candidatus Zambryskibacteria bacterium CG10_big_fil_rev_8_21_14_0_10_42_12]